MNVDVFVHPDNSAVGSIGRVLAPYGDLLRVTWHGPESGSRCQQLLLASFPLDASTGHTVSGEAPDRSEMSYGYYGAYGSGGTYADYPAVAIFDRMALLASSGGPPRQERSGVWSVPFGVEDLLRAAFHQALEAAFAEVREAHERLRATRPALMHDAAAALLQVTPAALDRALRRLPRRS